MHWRKGQPTSLWVLLGPAFTSIGMVLQLFNERSNKLIPALILAGCLGLVFAVLVQRRIAREARRTDDAPSP